MASLLAYCLEVVKTNRILESPDVARSTAERVVLFSDLDALARSGYTNNSSIRISIISTSTFAKHRSHRSADFAQPKSRSLRGSEAGSLRCPMKTGQATRTA